VLKAVRTGAVVIALGAVAPVLHGQAPLRVIASNGVRTLVDDLVPAGTGGHAAVTYGTSAVLVKDIAAGARFDVVIAAADAIEQIGKAGKLAADPPTTIARSVVGVGVKRGAPKPRVDTPAELRRALLGAKKVSYAANGASRPHIEQMFASLGIADAMKPASLLEPGSDGAIARVKAGDADLLLTLVSEILPAAGIELVGPLPPEFRSEVRFAAAVSAAAADPAAARRLIRSLVSPAATARLREKGLER
jgi:molybdate transport system substrate-binding protein